MQRVARRRGVHAFLVAAGVLGLVGAACSNGSGSGDGSSDGGGEDGGGAEGATEVVYPDPQWVEGDAAALGIDQAALDELVQFAADQPSNCLVVTRDGELVGEWYWEGTDASTQSEIYSATKSITSALVGIAQDQGLLDIDDPASDYITEWQGTDSEDVTIRNLLSNDSGREWDLITDYVDMAAGAEDKSAFSAALGQQFEPGTVWEYNNAAIQNLETVLEQATGMDVARFAEENLFEPIRMTNTDMGHDLAGNTILFFNAKTTCRDLARFGYLFLREGEWADGEQVVSAEYVEESTSPSTELNSAYGYLWWLNEDGHWVDSTDLDGKPEGDGLRVEGAPEDMFAAQGLGGQLSIVYPSSGVVVSRIGPTESAVDLDAGGSGDLDLDFERLGARLVPAEEVG